MSIANGEGIDFRANSQGPNSAGSSRGETLFSDVDCEQQGLGIQSQFVRARFRGVLQRREAVRLGAWDRPTSVCRRQRREPV